jgi:hypothetical protein
VPGSLAVRMFRAARRLLLPRDVGSPHEAEALTTAAALADDAARRGRGAAVAYWTAEFLSLVRAALAARRRDPQLPDDFIPSSGSRFMLSTVLHDVRYAFRLLRRNAGVHRPGRIAFVRDAIERLQGLPGAQLVAAGSSVPLAGRGNGAWFNMLDRPLAAGQTPPGSRTA